MKRLGLGLVLVGSILGCEDVATGPSEGPDPSLSVFSVGALRYVSVDAQPPVIGQPYVRQFSVVGGRPPYKWSVENGAVATGLTLSGGGLLTGTTRDPSLYVYSVRVTDADGMTEEIGIGGTPNRGVNVGFSLGAIALGSVVVGGETGYQPFFQGGTPPYTFTATGLPPGLVIDRATGLITGSATKPGAYEVAISLKDAAGAVPDGSPSRSSILVVRPAGATTSSRASGYGGAWTGLFTMQTRWCPVGYGTFGYGAPCDRYVGASLTRQTLPMETDVLAVKADMVVEETASPSGGIVVLAVKKITLSEPAFGCMMGCEPDPGSVLILDTSSGRSPLVNGVGVYLVGPGGRFTLSTSNETSAVEMRFGGTILGSAQDPAIRISSWQATIGDELFENVAAPRLLAQPEARVTQASWIVAKGAF